MPHASERPRRVTVDPDGPLLVEGPVEVVAGDGTVSVSDRFTVAICTCRRSRTYPWCDTSHRGRTKTQTTAEPKKKTTTQSAAEPKKGGLDRGGL